MTDESEDVGTEGGGLDELEERRTMPAPEMIPPEKRDTLPPEPEPPVTESRVVALVDDLVDERIKPLKKKISDIHELLMGKQLEDGSKVGGIGQFFHDMNQHLTAIKGTSELADEQQKLLPEIVADSVANKVLALYQGLLNDMGKTDASLQTQVSELRERLVTLEKNNGPNGHGEG